MARTFQLLLLTCLACAGGALAAKGADDAGWFGVPAADANLVTTPVVDRLEALGNDTATYDDEEYFDAEGDAVDVETSSIKTTTTASSSVAPTAKNSSAATKTTTPRARSTTVSSSSAKPPEARRAKASSSVGKTEEVNYWQTDGLADQPAGGSSRTSGSEEARDEPQVSVKEHDRNPHPFAFSASGDNEWFGFGEGDGAPSSGGGGGGSKSRLGGSASVAVEDYQTKEQQSGSKDVELETAVEIKEHDELAPGAGGGGFSSSADGGWFGDFGSSNAGSSSSKSGSKSPPASSDGGGGGGAADDVWFGVEASEWQPVAVSSHRQQRRLNWDEDEKPAESAARDYEGLDIITAPPDAGRSRDVYSFVVESSFGGGDRRGRGSGKKDTDGVEDVEIVTAASSADLGWFGDAQEQVRTETTTPPPTTKKVVVKSRTSTSTVRSTVIGRSRSRVGGVVSRNHSFIDLLAKKAGAGGGSSVETVPKVQKPVIRTNGSLALDVAVTALSGATVARNVSLTTLQNVTSAPSIDAREEDNSVNASPRNQSVITALPTATKSTTTTAAPITTTTTTTTASVVPEPTKIVPQIPTSAPKATATGVNISAAIDQAATLKPGPVQEPASDVGSAFGEPEFKEESTITPSTESSAAKTTSATVLPTRSGRTFVEEAATRPKHAQSSREEAVPSRTGSGDAPANFTSASAASEPRTVVLRGDANGHMQAGSSASASDNLSYILVGTCCAVSLICLAVVVLVVRRRKSLRRRRSSPHPPFQPGQLYAPTSYSYPPSARTGHFAAHPKDGATVAPPDAKARMWFMGRKQSPYSLCDQHLSYCSRDAATDYKQTDGGRRHSDGGALANAAPPPPVYRTGFSGLSDARHSSGLDYMNKGEMIYWSSNNEQLI